MGPDLGIKVERINGVQVVAICPTFRVSLAGRQCRKLVPNFSSFSELKKINKKNEKKTVGTFPQKPVKTCLPSGAFEPLSPTRFFTNFGAPQNLTKPTFHNGIKNMSSIPEFNK